MAFAKLKAAFKRKSAANRNPGADPPAPSTTGGHGAQPSQQVSQTVAPVPGTGGGQSSQQVAQPPPPPSTSATQPSQPVSQMPAPVPHTSATPVPVPRTSSRRVPGQAQVREGEDVGAAPANRRFLRLRAAMNRLRSFFRRGGQNEGEQAETVPGNRPRSSLSIRTVPRGNTPPGGSSQADSLRVWDGHSMEEERVINAGFSVIMQHKNRQFGAN